MKGVKLIQLVKIVLRGTDHEHHGCLSGDCPHEKQEQCLEALLEECALVVDQEREKSKHSKEWADLCQKMRDNAIHQTERLREELRQLGIGFAIVLDRHPGGQLTISQKVEQELGQKLFVEVHVDHATRTRTYRACTIS